MPMYQTDFNLTRVANRLNIEYDIGLDTAYLLARAVFLSYSIINVLEEEDSEVCGHLVREVAAIAHLHMHISSTKEAIFKTIFDTAGKYVALEIKCMLLSKAKRRTRS